MSQPPPIQIQFATKGLDEVQRALRSIQDLVSKTERKSSAAAKAKSSKEEVKAIQDVVTSLKNYAQAEKMVTAASRAGVSARVRDFQKEADLRKKYAQQSAKELNRISAQIERDEQRSASRRVREAEKAEKQRADAAKGRADRMARIVTGSQAFTTQGAVGRGVSAAARVGGGLVRGALDVGGGFGIVDSLQQEVALQGKAAGIVASSPGSFSAADIRSRAQQVAISQGIDPSEVMDAYDQIKKLTGDLGMALQATPGLAKIATATGANLGDIGGLAGNILAAKPSTTKKELEDQVRLFAQQGMVGGVEISDFAKLGGRITAGAGLFGGDASKNQAVLGGMAQIARQYGGAASPAEAVLASQRFATDIQKKAGHLEGMGIKVSDGHGRLRDASSIALDMLEKTGGDVTKLSSLNLGERGNRVMTGLSSIYRDAGGGQEGKNAVLAELKKYTEASLTAEEVEARNKKRQASIDIQVNKAMLELRNTVGTQLVPVLSQFISQTLVPAMPAVTQLFETFAQMAKVLVDHPLLGLGAIIGASIAKELAMAGLQEVVRSALAKAIAGGGVSSVTPSGGGSVLGTGAALGAGAGLVIGNAMLKYENGTDQAMDYAAKLRAYAKGDRERGMSPEQVQGELDKAKGRLGKTGTLEQVGNLLTSPFVDASSRDYAQYKKDQGLTDNAALQKALQEVTQALKDNADAQRAGGSISDPNNPGRGNGGPVGAPARVRGRPL